VRPSARFTHSVSLASSASLWVNFRVALTGCSAAPVVPAVHVRVDYRILGPPLAQTLSIPSPDGLICS